MRRLSWTRMSLVWAIILSIVIKTYMVSRFVFNLEIESGLQEFILLLSSFSLLPLVALLVRWKKERMVPYLIVCSFLSTILLYFNIVYYRFFNDFLTIPVLFQTDNVSSLGKSVGGLVEPVDFILFLDVLLYLFLHKRRRENSGLDPRHQQVLLMMGVAALLLNLALAHIERPGLLKRSFDRRLLVKNLGIYSYLVYDAIIQTNTNVKKAFANNDKLAEVMNFTSLIHREDAPVFTGMAKGRNLIVISLESTQGFVVNRNINGQPLTPFLNELIRTEGSYYFSNFYHQTGQGKTSDSEFILENSLYGLPRSAVFFTHSKNKYVALPKILKKEAGYYTAVFHANNKSFWNRNLMYEALGYDRFYHDQDYSINEQNSVGWGLKDEDFFKQSLPMLQTLPQPFYAKFILLTNHFPYELGAEDKKVPEWTSKDGTVNRYITTVRYQDEALKMFFEDIKKTGLYRNSIFVLYGDHYGISNNHNKAMSELLGKPITSFEEAQLQKVPLLIHIPGIKNKAIVNTVGGQIDLKPTILHLLGVQTPRPLVFGSSLFSKNPDELVIFRDGSYVSEHLVYTKNKCYNKATGAELDRLACQSILPRVEQELSLSDQVIYGDLLRFQVEKKEDAN